MIIPLDSDSDVKLKDVGETDVVVNRAVVPDDSPPAYFHSESQVVVSPAEVPPPPIPTTSKPTNFLSLSRGNESIKGTYVIDPRIKIPQFLLPPLAADETEVTRRNVFLHTSNGSINVDFFVVGDGDSKQKVDILLKSSNGSVSAKLHASHTARPPVNLKAQSSNGAITLHIPRSFRGPLTICSRNGSIRFSDALSADLTTFNEVNRTRRCFVGDFSDWADQPEGWMGDEVNVESLNGSVKIHYDAETSRGATDGGSKGKGKSTFLGRLLGL
ncbi:hypothetical protein B0H19DRAFT_988003 [Mycena capillaripes]|nr:hypothetical protein B0H19DRAFT_988003 [Mycena capillaripes]